MTDEEALRLHDRAALGEPLTDEERARLQSWYAAEDAAEARELGAAGTDPAEDVRPLVQGGIMSELVFEVTQEGDGGFVAECLTEGIFTQADSWGDLRHNVKEAVEAFYFDRPQPTAIRLHLTRDELMAFG